MWMEVQKVGACVMHAVGDDLVANVLIHDFVFLQGATYFCHFCLHISLTFLCYRICCKGRKFTFCFFERKDFSEFVN